MATIVRKTKNRTFSTITNNDDFAGPFGPQHFPTRRDEAWKYTSLHKVAQTIWKQAPKELDKNAVIPENPLPASKAFRLVIINGRFSQKLSDLLPPYIHIRQEKDPPGTSALSLLDFENQAIARMNAFGGEKSLCIDIDAHIKEKISLMLHHVSVKPTLADVSCDSNILLAPRFALNIGTQSHVTLTEIHTHSCGAGAIFCLPVFEIMLNPSARLEHYCLTTGQQGDVQTSLNVIQQEEASIYEGVHIQLHEGIGRRESHIHLKGEQAETTLREAAYGSNHEVLDHSTEITHHEKNAKSHQFYRGVMGGQARGVFQGKTIICQNASGSDGRQSSKALLLSHRAEMDAKPALEIYNDDVQCAHGATCGEIDQDQIFYLKSRGIPEEKAKTILIEAFLTEILEKIQNEDVRVHFEAALFEKIKLDIQL